MLRFVFNSEKALAAILYISKQLIEHTGRTGAGIHHIAKVLYFADQKHLARYARPIAGDHYIAMKYGPVPSKIYDMIKSMRGDGCCDIPNIENYLEVRGHFVIPKMEADLDELSETELACINESLQENQGLSFEELKNKSHGRAYARATKDDKISYLNMANEAKVDENILRYMRLLSENVRMLEA